MNSKGHLFISIAKSVVRMVGCVSTILVGSVVPLAVCLFVAEVGGIAEELVDKR